MRMRECTKELYNVTTWKCVQVQCSKNDRKEHLDVKDVGFIWNIQYKGSRVMYIFFKYMYVPQRVTVHTNYYYYYALFSLYI